MDLNYDALEKSLNAELKPLYLIYGDYQYLIDTCVEKN